MHDVMQKTRSTARLLSATLVTIAVVGCRIDQPAAPDVRPPSTDDPRLTLHPVATYSPVRPFAGQRYPSRAYDVNELNQVVGWHRNSAFFIDLGQPQSTRYLSAGQRARYEARGLNDKGEIVGFGADGQFEYPVYWASPTSAPVELSVEGNVLEINNAGLAVGWILKGRSRVPFLWDTRTNAVHLIPRPPGIGFGPANSINDDNIIAGDGVMWQYLGNGRFFSQYMTFTAKDIDAGYMMVGWSRAAVFGTPWTAAQLIGPGAGAVLSDAYGISHKHVAVGELRFPNPTTLPNGVSEAFAVELSNLNGMIFLPKVHPLRSAAGLAVNPCGVIVGFESGGVPGYAFNTSDAIIWDPGC
jgi:hypothetical protein